MPIMQLGPLGASVADVPGVGALCSTPPRAAPHPTIKTNRPALARSATSDLPMFVITLNCRRRSAFSARCRLRFRTVPPVLVGVRKPGGARPGGEGAVMWEDEPMTDRPTCRRCGHLRVCHRRGRCEYVQRLGWVPSHNTFTTEVPCECEGWQEPK
jgi:hypothetical protein